MARVSLALATVLVLSACAEPVDPNRETDYASSQVPAEVPEPELDVPPGLESDGNIPSLAELQLALATCMPAQEAVEAQCEPSEEGTEFTCRYSLEDDTPETEREAVIAADGDGYILVDIPEDCDTQ
ncbi:hypothetical protein [Alteriqipengyuania lutimaris]|uniref:DUF4333 domain-containing protein n=1 Tax=Alteriqipengyuania lutimaris TaxID=1538146 RepID=A0A395LHF9_9SPHN|nr:hypothetical protein [Alteriqipengyuania lutimaris]MBB3035529.1 hypothetical protein [Alteriqipengyuania lutimaris]RDS76085.1 hypothetical protein DL238_15645 [Alteriqipengyuania lutimaris]